MVSGTVVTQGQRQRVCADQVGEEPVFPRASPALTEMLSLWRQCYLGGSTRPSSWEKNVCLLHDWTVRNSARAGRDSTQVIPGHSCRSSPWLIIHWNWPAQGCHSQDREKPRGVGLFASRWRQQEVATPRSGASSTAEGRLGLGKAQLHHRNKYSF